MNEVEMVLVINDVFKALNLETVTKLNNRKILAGIAEVALVGEDAFADFTVALDKLDKIGFDNVMAELSARGFNQDQLGKIKPFMILKGNLNEKMDTLKAELSISATGLEGIAEMQYIFERISLPGMDSNCELDITLARGLNYYTGTIFEVKATEAEMGSLCGGGRYDNLTGVFGLPDISGVGISFGADRIYDVLLKLERFPGHEVGKSQVMLANFGEEEEKFCLKLAERLRKSGISTEIYPSPSKLKKQLKYADDNQIPYVVLAGENEIREGTVTVKNMKSGKQETVAPEQLPEMIRKDQEE
jgi:histidyl-tRNA synthetase